MAPTTLSEHLVFVINSETLFLQRLVTAMLLRASHGNGGGRGIRVRSTRQTVPDGVSPSLFCHDERTSACPPAPKLRGTEYYPYPSIVPDFAQKQIGESGSFCSASSRRLARRLGLPCNARSAVTLASSGRLLLSDRCARIM